MSKQVSAGLLLYKTKPALQVFLVHPGGPFFQNKDKGWWTIPKGLPEENESLQEAALREFAEETGHKPQGEMIEMGSIRQKGGKTVHAWAMEGDMPPDWEHTCNTFHMEWPPRSGKFEDFPEIDRACFFNEKQALEYINEAQKEFILRLKDLL